MLLLKPKLIKDIKSYLFSKRLFFFEILKLFSFYIYSVFVVTFVTLKNKE